MATIDKGAAEFDEALETANEIDKLLATKTPYIACHALLLSVYALVSDSDTPEASLDAFIAQLRH